MRTVLGLVTDYVRAIRGTIVIRAQRSPWRLPTTWLVMGAVTMLWVVALYAINRTSSDTEGRNAGEAAVVLPDDRRRPVGGTQDPTSPDAQRWSGSDASERPDEPAVDPAAGMPLPSPSTADDRSSPGAPPFRTSEDRAGATEGAAATGVTEIPEIPDTSGSPAGPDTPEIPETPGTTVVPSAPTTTTPSTTTTQPPADPPPGEESGGLVGGLLDVLGSLL